MRATPNRERALRSKLNPYAYERDLYETRLVEAGGAVLAAVSCSEDWSW
ncbi:hypothetical protein H7J83_22440 [Mycobacterium mantenii]|nr:hypothetical protein [Mycobacterium mantenii]MCV7245449.1 hypothetical protein [Mycobacterium mantenii]